MIVAIHQPQYLPWLGYFDKMRIADFFCYLDNVQYKKNEWQNRNRIKTAQDWQWLTVPVSFRFPQKINEVKINNTINWNKKHLQALTTNYSKSPHFKDYMELLEDILTKEWDLLSELNLSLLERLRKFLNLNDKPTVLASSLDLREDPTDRLIDICKLLGADAYLAGQDGGNYMDLKRFKDHGIALVTQEFKHPVYPQLYGDFQSHMSVIDLLFNCGPESINIIEAANPS